MVLRPGFFATLIPGLSELSQVPVLADGGVLFMFFGRGRQSH